MSERAFSRTWDGYIGKDVLKYQLLNPIFKSKKEYFKNNTLNHKNKERISTHCQTYDSSYWWPCGRAYMSIAEDLGFYI